ncbi:MAG: hypothetical protein ABIZ56_11965 [Chthoniobacteraceae bacterium]
MKLPRSIFLLALAMHAGALIAVEPLRFTFGNGKVAPGGKRALADTICAYELARCVVEGIRAAKLPLAEFLADDLPPFDPSHPDPVEFVAIPPSPLSTKETPLGN